MLEAQLGWWSEASQFPLSPDLVDRRGESEESGDDETRRKSVNGEVDPNQPATTGKTSQALSF